MDDQTTKSNNQGQNGVIGMSFDPRVLLKQKLSKRIRRLALVPVVLAVLALGSWIYYQQTYAYGTVQYANGGHTYSVRFTKGAAISTVNSVSYVDGYSLQDFKQVAVTIKPTDDIFSINFSCKTIGSGWVRTSYEQVGGQSVPVCSENQAVFEMVFPAGGKNYLAEVISRNGKAPVNSDTVNTIFSSIVVK